jgi:hypothetical protein
VPSESKAASEFLSSAWWRLPAWHFRWHVFDLAVFSQTTEAGPAAAADSELVSKDEADAVAPRYRRLLSLRFTHGWGWGERQGLGTRRECVAPVVATFTLNAWGRNEDRPTCIKSRSFRVCKNMCGVCMNAGQTAHSHA